MNLFDVVHHLVGFGNHFQRIVVTDRHAFSAAFTLTGVNDDRKLATLTSFLFGAGIILIRFGPGHLAKEFAVVFVVNFPQTIFPILFTNYFAKNSRVGAQGYTIHAPGTLIIDVFWNLWRNITEISERSRARRHQRSGYRQVCRQLLFSSSILVTTDDAVIEVFDIKNGKLNVFVVIVDQRSIRVVIVWITIVRIIH